LLQKKAMFFRTVSASAIPTGVSANTPVRGIWGGTCDGVTLTSLVIKLDDPPTIFRRELGKILESGLVPMKRV
jgi:hypothetical protein